ncbi:MAG: 1-deoxy-D-xylulose-5-phosphate reductoisomerase [Clostridiales Family XIII bacterium]|jgi:1-deoxy-D-xylulose-5-phosphate reductoisomerase|nr:1-deoxy-D-xylulose-5-phosphate reductoisomerase [Clostridiales Family XIII bacterium]
MKRVAILGSTGSVGTQALSVIASNPRRLKPVLLSCKSRVDMLRNQIQRFHPEAVVIERKEDAAEFRREYHDIKVYCGASGLDEALADTDFDIMLNALVGIAGLKPTLAAIKKGAEIGGISVALANKETLVTGGRLVTEAARKAGVPLVPVDSEHSAIFQCLQGNQENPIKRIILTASGGPFRGYDRERLSAVTLGDALQHPNWKMGRKITVDSATMLNKGFEIIEAKWLYGIEASRIEVAIHPQSIIHSLVEFEDGALLAQLGNPDMKVPISYAFSWPERWATDNRALDLIGLRSLFFEEPLGEGRRSLDMAYRVLRESEETGHDSGSIVLNSANEALVELFLAGKIPFLTIIDTLERILDRHESKQIETIGDIFEVDKEARRAVARRWK